MNNYSPWLDFDRPDFPTLTSNLDFDVAIIGGGIAGVSTLYYLLKNTTKKIVLLEKDKIASGATGHNAGFAINWIERFTQELINDFGLEKTKIGYQELDHGWDLINEIVDECKYGKINFIEGGGEVFTSVEHFFRSAAEEEANEKIGRGAWQYFLSQNLQVEIPAKLEEYIRIVPQKIILDRFDLKDKGFIAAAIPTGKITKKARINSAKFCYQVLEYLKDKYKERFFVFENTEIKTAVVKKLGQKLKSGSGSINSSHIVLCTNGYVEIKICDEDNFEVIKLKNSIIRYIGYATGFFDKSNITQAAALFDDRGIYKDSPYFYYHHVPTPDEEESLAVLGGPEKNLTGEEVYHSGQPISDEINNIYKEFLLRTYGESRSKFDYSWYGLMGYTKNGTRWVGPDSKYPSILYNLGCNGIGIISSVMGGEKISRIINGEKFPPSMFDPQ